MTALAAIIDTETTGLGALDEAIELGVVVFAFDPSSGAVLHTVREFHALREPAVPITPGARRVHGIRAADVRGHHLDEPAYRRALADVVLLISHNAAFDRYYVERLSDATRNHRWVCSLRAIDWRAHVGRASLPAIAAHYGIATATSHRAIDDARCTLAIVGQRLPDGRTVLRHLLDSPNTASRRPSSASPQSRPAGRSTTPTAPTAARNNEAFAWTVLLMLLVAAALLWW